MISVEQVSTIIAVLFGAYQAIQRYLERDKSEKRRIAQHFLAERHRLVTALFRMAQGRCDFDEAEARYHDLLLAAEAACHLDIAECALDVVRRFKSEVIDPARRKDLSSGQLAKRIRLLADEFNAIVGLPHHVGAHRA